MSNLKKFREIFDSALFFSWNDILQRYRGSIIGPLWITILILVSAIGMSFIYGAINGMAYQEALAYIFTGLTGWALINGLLTESTTNLIISAGIIKNTKTSIWFHIFRLICRNAIVAAHNIPAVFLVLLFCGKLTLLSAVGGVAGMIFVIIVLTPLVATLSMLGARFRDIPQAIISIMQFFMLVTPVFWSPTGSRGIAMRAVTEYNPLYYLLEIIRRPFIGQALNWSWVAWLSIFAICAYAINFLIIRKFSGRIAFWV